MKFKLVLFVFFALQISVNAQTPQYLSKFPKLKSAPERQPKDITKAFPFDIALKDTAGNLYSSAAVLPTKKKPLVVLFWLTTCGPCRMELETIKENYDAWKKETDFRFIAISTDFDFNYAKFIDRVRVSGWQFEAYNDVQHEFMSVMPGELNGLPQLFVFDDAGKIIYTHRRFIPGDEKELFEVLKTAAPSNPKAVKNGR